MVVSGLPVPNGDAHAGQIASLALTLLNQIKTFEAGGELQNVVDKSAGY